MKTQIAYKALTRRSKKLFSYVQENNRYDHGIRYVKGKWVKPRPDSPQCLMVFKTLKRVREFTGGDIDVVIYECEIEKTPYSEKLGRSFFTVSYCRKEGWPRGTVFAKRVKLLRRV